MKNKNGKLKGDQQVLFNGAVDPSSSPSQSLASEMAKAAQAPTWSVSTQNVPWRDFISLEIKGEEDEYGKGQKSWRRTDGLFKRKVNKSTGNHHQHRWFPLGFEKLDEAPGCGLWMRDARLSSRIGLGVIREFNMSLRLEELCPMAKSDRQAFRKLIKQE
ncbi:hypothetical protein H0E87_016707 [Populus deltoides]|uniref:Uncharacterized protein n=1 Tax=Populus deltoides TaxID=3696 RepID=A0A8T2YAF7_POPDE|nr:hypothetical protein H0E87_016707 [Populus deltoides]